MFFILDMYVIMHAAFQLFTKGFEMLCRYQEIDQAFGFQTLFKWSSILYMYINYIELTEKGWIELCNY